MTEAGAVFLESAERIAEELDLAVDRLVQRGTTVTGVLRINAPRVAIEMVFTRLVSEMTLLHPQLIVELITDDALTDVVAEGFDAGVRLGEMIDHDMVAVRLTPPLRAIMVAAQSYIARAGEPKTVGELSSHNCIGFRLLRSGAVYAWDLKHDGKDVRVDVSGTTRVSDPTFARDLALDGVGIRYLLEPLVRTHVAAGRLPEILPKASIIEPGFFLYYPKQASRAPKLRAILEVIRKLREEISAGLSQAPQS